jgi:hypothetical protein
LKILRLVLPTAYTTSKYADFYINGHPIGSLRQFTQLKRLEVAHPVMWNRYDRCQLDEEALAENLDGANLRAIIPTSLHTLSFVSICGNFVPELYDFLEYLVVTQRARFPHLAHINNLRGIETIKNLEPLADFDPPRRPERERVVEALRRLKILTYPSSGKKSVESIGRYKKSPPRYRVFPSIVRCSGDCRITELIAEAGIVETMT